MLCYDGAWVLTIPSSANEHRPLRSGLFSPTSSMLLGVQLVLTSGWKGRVSGVGGEGAL